MGRSMRTDSPAGEPAGQQRQALGRRPVVLVDDPVPSGSRGSIRRVGVATKAEVTRALERLMARLDGKNGHVSPPVETPVPGTVDVTLQVRSDDLVDLVEERTTFVSAFLSGKVRVQASMMDLLRLRTLL